MAHYPLCRRVSVPHGQSGHMWETVPLPGFDPQTVQPIASCYTNCAIPATLVSMLEFASMAQQPLVGQGPLIIEAL